MEATVAEQKVLALVINPPHSACYLTATIKRRGRKTTPDWEGVHRIFRIKKAADWTTRDSFTRIEQAAASLGVRFRGIDSNEKLEGDITRIIIRVQTHEVVPFME